VEPVLHVAVPGEEALRAEARAAEEQRAAGAAQAWALSLAAAAVRAVVPEPDASEALVGLGAQDGFAVRAVPVVRAVFEELEPGDIRDEPEA
jgi:hypothetical protein